MIEKIKALRKELHRHPELSGREVETANRIRAFVEANSNAKIIEGIGGTGMAVIFDYVNNGPVIVIRCELDALPIEEANGFDYRSTKPGISHKCGHDGHMAIVAGLNFWLNEQSFRLGKVILLFQPAEETGNGAAGILNDPAFRELNPDYVFALHNIPGEPLHSVILMKNNFSCTVHSLGVYLQGRESHASEPEKGINPAAAIAGLINEFERLNVKDVRRKEFALLTPVCIKMGQPAYGISAGEGEVHFTLRTISVEEMDRLKASIQQILVDICNQYQLNYRTEWSDYFPSVRNDEFCIELVKKAAKENGLDIIEKDAPFKFGEDFGWFSQKYASAMFGLGAGVECPALHSADYDFPDEIIETGMGLFGSIINGLLE